MATALLIIIYITFIGIGIPDSLFGTAWPAIYTELNLPVSWAGFVTLTISGGTIISSLLSAKLISRFGAGKVTAFSTVMTVVALWGFAGSKSFVSLWIMAIPLGLGAGAIDTALNNYVALHYKASHMNFLHCFYGIGVSMSPFLMSLALGSEGDWQRGYWTVSWFQLAIAVVSVSTLPLWKKQKFVDEVEESKQEIQIGDLLKSPKMYLIGLILFGSCATEYVCGNWGSTFLVNVKDLPVDMAAAVITFYYVGIALGRVVSGLLAGKCTCWQLIIGGQGITLLAIILLFFSLSIVASGIALFLVGFGNGPVFPNMMHLTPTHFGKAASQSVMGLQMSIAYLGILSAPALFGVLAQNIGVGIFPYYLILMYAVMIFGTLGIKVRK